MTHMELGLQELDIVTDERRKAALEAVRGACVTVLDCNPPLYSANITLGHDQCILDEIIAALQSPAVPVIEGLEEVIALVQRHQYWRRGAEIEMENPKELGIAIDKLIKAARAYAELQKGVLPSSVDTNRKEV